MTSTPPQWDTGRILQRAREDAGLSRAQAAENAGMSESWWLKLEKGYTTRSGKIALAHPRAETLARAAEAVGLDPNALLVPAGLRESPVEDGLLEGLTQSELEAVSAFIQGLKAAREL
ncbi:helix-turn-helix transcriptional regulator [Corynebacterium sp. HMSC065A05]|uniref:helix-turn-helix domain-containing protein n=1 Tax=Corynebacterium sp. HMSC065A05 TaxID=1739502 RepID=UPI0009F4399D|nr:helix-turn-helix transcriptional regulator [Corynebacterium sp. HMSC065A05]